MHYFQLQKSAFHSLKGRWGFVYLCLLIFFFLYAPLMLIGELVNLYSLFTYGMPIEQPIWYTVLDIATSLVLMSTLSFGLTFVFLSISRNESVHVRYLFIFLKNGKQIFRAIRGTIVPSIYILLWCLLLIIPGIYKAYCYAMTPYILVDHPELNVRQAMKKSIQIMHGHKWHYFVLSLSFIGWGILCILTLGIGYFWLIPVIHVTNAKFYLKVSGQQ
ncbi:DUF975 family protein [Shimazuella sp. AN120528]|uniref:DUF975 family protein n=1 Tax=Shimazuella soli TaxID=1892854 RepID=UPI001F1086EE|nr:DUF975 family protein [Shimazuella soli]MCH5584038.1 DUF975 family protein [Shimazuella soli]